MEVFWRHSIVLRRTVKGLRPLQGRQNNRGENPYQRAAWGGLGGNGERSPVADIPPETGHGEHMPHPLLRPTRPAPGFARKRKAPPHLTRLGGWGNNHGLSMKSGAKLLYGGFDRRKAFG